MRTKKVNNQVGRHTLFVMLLCACIISGTEKAHSQESLYIENAANIFVHSDTVNILGSVQNKGNFGSKPGAVIRFGGLLWHNDSTASMPDEGSYIRGSVPAVYLGKGGVFWFTQSSGSTAQPQIVHGGYSMKTRKGVSFPNLKVDNTKDIFLSGDIDMEVRNNLQFSSGHLWVNGQQLIVGDSTPGTITGYDEKKYVVTGTASSGGFLYRARINRATGAMVFPVGADLSQYSPVEITHQGKAQDFKVRVFNDIYSKATTGTTGDPAFVQNTWNIGKESKEDSNTIVRVQHAASKEGSTFSAKRDSAYLTFFNTTRQVWDTIQPSGSATGTLTTGQVQPGTYVNLRNFVATMGTNEYLGKSVNTSPNYLGTRIGLSKMAGTATMLADGSFTVRYTILVKNGSASDLMMARLSDNLRTTFPSPIAITVNNLSVSGKLVVNPAYDGVADTLLVTAASRIDAGKTDTVLLDVNIKSSNIFGTFYNLARIEGIAGTGASFISVASTNGSVVDASGNAVPSATPANLNALDIKPPAGFSPNGDGVNEKFVIANSSGNDLKLEVYDRLGNRVYRSPGVYANDWDGTCNQPGAFVNRRLPEGTYYYVITQINKQTGEVVSSVVGFITLQR